MVDLLLNNYYYYHNFLVLNLIIHKNYYLMHPTLDFSNLQLSHGLDVPLKYLYLEYLVQVFKGLAGQCTGARGKAI